MNADLHLHTDHSDGTFLPEEVIRRAKVLGLAAVSITDHDTAAGLSEAIQAAAGAIEIIPGVELTATYRDRELHILGYCVDCEEPGFKSFLTRMQAYRRERIQTMLDRLAAYKIQIAFEEVEKIAGRGALGRPHVAEALLAHKVVKSMDEAFRQYLGDRAPCFVKGATVTVSGAVEIIRKAGGVAILAHPHRMVEDAWLSDLVANGIQGIEVYHPDHDPSVVKKYRRIVKERQLLMSGGSDCHGMRRDGGPVLGTVTVPYECVERLKAAAGRSGEGVAV